MSPEIEQAAAESMVRHPATKDHATLWKIVVRAQEIPETEGRCISPSYFERACIELLNEGEIAASLTSKR